MNATVHRLRSTTSLAVMAMMATSFHPVHAGVPAPDMPAEPVTAPPAAPAIPEVPVETPADNPPVETPEDSEPVDVEEALPTPAVLTRTGNVVVDRAALSSALAMAKLVTEKRNTIPILSNVLIVGETDKALSVVATDLDMEISILVPAAVDYGFGLTVPTHMLESFLKKAPKCDMVAMVSEGEYPTGFSGGSMPARIEFDKVTYKVQTLPTHDFPALPIGDVSHQFTMNGAAFRKLLDSVSAAISTEETRYYLNGVYLHSSPPRGNSPATLVAVTTDGHRLYKREIMNDDVGFADMPGAIIPRGAVELLLKLTKGKACPESVVIAVNRTKMRFTFGNVALTTKLIDGTFPDHQRVIPTRNERIATFDSVAMREALDAVGVISTERGRAVKLTVTNGRIFLAVNNPDAGSASAEVPATFRHYGFNDPELEIGFNMKYLSEALEEAGDGEIVAEFDDSGSPTIFRGSDENWMCVQMPMRV